VTRSSSWQICSAASMRSRRHGSRSQTRGWPLARTGTFGGTAAAPRSTTRTDASMTTSANLPAHRYGTTRCDTIRDAKCGQLGVKKAAGEVVGVTPDARTWLEYAGRRALRVPGP
jgi:hypothetical protein